MVPNLQWFDLKDFFLALRWCERDMQWKLYFEFKILISSRATDVWVNTHMILDSGSLPPGWRQPKA